MALAESVQADSEESSLHRSQQLWQTYGKIWQFYVKMLNSKCVQNTACALAEAARPSQSTTFRSIDS